MNKYSLAAAITLSGLSFLLPLKSHAGEEQQQTIRMLGQLNGIALHCKYLQHSQHMKQALIKNLPKERILGDLFDSATNESFLNFINQGNSCPEESQFSKKVDAGISALEQAYKKH